MLNYMKAEVYRNFNRMAFWNFVIIVSILSVLVNIALEFTPAVNELGLSNLLEIGLGMLSTPILLVLIVIDMVTAEEQKNLTLKNTISYGISRNKVVISKLVITALLSLIAAIIVLTVFMGSGAIMFGIDDAMTFDFIKDFALRLLAASTIWMGAISFGTFLALIMNKSNVFGFLYAGIFFFVGQIFKLLTTFVSDKFQYIYDILLTSRLEVLGQSGLTNSDLRFSILVGISYTIIFGILSMIYFSKKEIK